MVRSQDVNPVRAQAEHLIGRRVHVVTCRRDGGRDRADTLYGIVRAVDDFGLDIGHVNGPLPWEWVSEIRAWFGPFA